MKTFVLAEAEGKRHCELFSVLNETDESRWPVLKRSKRNLQLFLTDVEITNTSELKDWAAWRADNEGTQKHYCQQRERDAG